MVQVYYLTTSITPIMAELPGNLIAYLLRDNSFFLFSSMASAREFSASCIQRGRSWAEVFHWPSPFLNILNMTRLPLSSGTSTLYLDSSLLEVWRKLNSLCLSPALITFEK